MADYTKAQLAELIVDKLQSNFGRTVAQAHPVHMFKACALVLRDMMASHSVVTEQQVLERHERQVHYLSLEFLMGRSLEKNAYNLGVLEPLNERIRGKKFRYERMSERAVEAMKAAIARYNP